MSETLTYSKTLLEHFNNPRNMGSLNKDAPDVGTGVVGSPECGDVMKLQIRVGPDGTIADARFKTFGCGAAIASSSLATEWLKGRTLDQARQLRNTELADALQLPPVKLHCSVLAESAVKAAIADYRRKHGESSAGESRAPCEECPGRAACAVAVETVPQADPLIALRRQAEGVLGEAGKVLAGSGLDPRHRRMLEMAVAMLRASVGRDDPDQIRLAMDMVRETAAEAKG